MKKIRLTVILIFITATLLGCQSEAPKTNLNDEGFVEPEPSQWVVYIKPVREYLYWRTQAVLHGDINLLWDRYPELKEDSDHALGINMEQVEVDQLNQSFDLIDANFSPESYERIKVHIANENEATVLVHGGIAYIRKDFDDSGGEFLMKLYIERRDGRWDVVKTDEYTLPEYKEWLNGRANH